MAVFSVTVPDKHLENTARGVANAMVGDSDPAIAAIAEKIVNGGASAATNAEKKAMAEAFCQRALHQACIDTMAADSSNATRADPNNAW